MINKYDYEGFEMSEFEYILFEMGYVHEMKETNPDYKDMDDNMVRDILFPIQWTTNKNYRLKACILAEAYENGVKVYEVPAYSQIVSDLVMPSNDKSN